MEHETESFAQRYALEYATTVRCQMVVEETGELITEQSARLLLLRRLVEWRQAGRRFTVNRLEWHSETAVTVMLEEVSE